MADERSDPWGSDVPVSMPQPIEDMGVTVDLGGFLMTHLGLRHNLTGPDLEALLAQQYQPMGGTRGSAQ